MDLKVESKIGMMNVPEEKIYKFLSDFQNFSMLVPADKIKNWQATEDTCHFSVDGFGEAGLRIIEKQPNSLIKIAGEESSKFDFTFWIQLKENISGQTHIKLTIKADVNPMIKMMVSKPLQNFVDSLVDQLCKMSF